MGVEVLENCDFSGGGEGKKIGGIKQMICQGKGKNL